MTLIVLTHLPDFLEWANSRSLEMLRRTPTENSASIFAHLLAAELVWAARLMEEKTDIPLRPGWSLEECAAAIKQSAAYYRDIVGRRDSEQSVTYRNMRGEQFTSSTGDILLHVFSHGSYHRGQISQEVRRTGGEIIDTDYILFQRALNSAL